MPTQMSSSREAIRTARQRAYWNGLADDYASMTRIRTDDFHWGPQIPGERALKLLPPLPRGGTALELGCGGAQNSVYLSKYRHLSCTALDVSAGQLAHAREIASAHKVDIEFLEASLEEFPHVIKRRTFEFVHSSHALEFVQDPAAVVRAMARATKPGGIVAVSTVHPVYNGEWIDGEFEDEEGDDAGSAGTGVFLQSYLNPPDDIRDEAAGHAVSRAWPVSYWFDAFRAAGLEVLCIAEPAATPDAPYTSDAWADHGGQLDEIPSTIILVGRKPATK